LQLHITCINDDRLNGVQLSSALMNSDQSNVRFNSDRMNSDRMNSIAISQTYALTYRLIASHVDNVDNSNNRLLATYGVV
jgi:hypothetical protein